MAENLKLTILSPERRVAEGIEVKSVTLPGSEGLIQILPGHAAMVGTLLTGIFQYEAASGDQDQGAVSTGFFEVRGDEIAVMAETLELQAEVDLVRAKSAQARAESALQNPELDDSKFRKYQLKLQRALIRQQLAGKTFQS